MANIAKIAKITSLTKFQTLKKKKSIRAPRCPQIYHDYRKNIAKIAKVKPKYLRECKSYSPSPMSAKQTSKSFSTNKVIQAKNEKKSIHYVTLKQAKKKVLETETALLTLKDVIIRD